MALVDRDTKPADAIPRSNPCGGRYRTAYGVWTACTSQAPAGLARCRRCAEAEAERAKALAEKRAAEATAPARRRRRA